MQGFGLSPQQERLWALKEDSSAYRAQCAIHITGPLDVKFLKDALRLLIQRHEILRTVFHSRHGIKIPVQVVCDAPMPEWRYASLPVCDPVERSAGIDDFMAAQARDSFDFEVNPLIRTTLVGLSQNEHVLLVCLPALCADGWTAKKLAGEIACCYAASLGQEALPSETVQYADYAGWINEMLDAENEEAQTGRLYWLRQEVSRIKPPALPFEKKVERSIFAPGSLGLTADPALFAQLEHSAQSYSASLEVYLLAGWATLLNRLTGQAEIVIGNLFDGRKFDELRDSLGLFARCLPIVCHFDNGAQFGTILSQLARTLSEAHCWQEYFADEVYRPSYLPAAFECQEQPHERQVAGVTFSSYKHYAHVDRFDLKLFCIRAEDSLITQIHYDSNIFKAEDVRRLLAQYHKLLSSAVNKPDGPITRLETLTDDEWRQLIIEVNDTKRSFSTDACIHHLFEDAAMRAPESVAVAFEDRQLTYAELNALANRLAHYLQARGAAPDSPVAICLDRSEQMVIAMLAVLKAGAAYVPLDPTLPKLRINAILEELRWPILLGQSGLSENLARSGEEVICLDKCWDAINGYGKQNPISGVTNENLAYIIFTSGSSGMPKGVAVEHRQLVNYVNGVSERLGLEASFSFAMVSTFAADLGHTVVFPCLSMGRRLHIISQERIFDPERLADYFSRNRIDCLKIAPSHLSALLASSGKERILPHRHLILGGEASGRALVDKLRSGNPDCSVFNHYGPTETTVGVLTYRVGEGQTEYPSSVVPLGRPLPNVRVYSLNDYLEPIATGVTGELYVGGAAVARGYFDRPDLTAEKFIPDPFSQEAGARLYKTGDLVRYMPDGNFEFIGRADNQLKIRGFRVELGEIEAVLNRHPMVKGAAVVAREAAENDKPLIAYVVPRSRYALTDSELRAFLKEQLPEYMLPRDFLLMDALPLTANGKIDRAALPAPDDRQSEKGLGYVAPRSEPERAIAAIWQKVLSVKEVGVFNNFFDIGGHSLMAIQVQSRLREVFEKEISVVDLFKYTTIASLAEYLTGTPGDGATFEQSRNRAESRLELMARRRRSGRGLE